MHYNRKSAEVVKEGHWDEKSCVRRVGGYDIDKTNLPAGTQYLPKGAVLSFQPSTGSVKVLKTAKVHSNANKSATSVQVEKGHILVVGDVLNGSTISAIEVGAEFDTLTISELGAAVKVGDVIAENASNVCGLNYATVKLDDMPSCTPTLQAYEIEEESLPYPVNAAIKEALTVRHAWAL